MMNAHVSLLAVAGLLGLIGSPVAGLERHVPTPDYPTIQSAVDACADGDVVIIQPNTYTGEGNRDIDLKGKAVTVRSTDPNDPNVVAATVIDCQGNPINLRRGFCFRSGEGADSVVAGLTITTGYADDGGAIRCVSSSPTIVRCVISGNTAMWGGGVYNMDSRPTLADCTSSWNVATSGGGVWNSGGGPTVTACEFYANTAAVGGGGAMVNFDGCSATLTGCQFNANVSTFGGAMYNHISDPTVIDCSFGENVGGHGGAIYNLSCGPTLTGCSFTGNSSFWGAGLDNYDHSYPTITDCTFSENWATWGGAMVDFGGSSSTLSGCVFSDNTAFGSLGGGICCRGGGSTTMTDCVFTGNAAILSSGGAIACQDGCRPTISRCTIRGNSCDNNGGGIYLEASTATLHGCTITENVAFFWGGGILCFDDADLVIDSCLIGGNAAQFGGGLVCVDGAEAVVANCTFAGNEADAAAGGVGCADNGGVWLANCILWANTSPTGPQISLHQEESPSTVAVAYCDVAGGVGGTHVDANCTLDWGEGNMDADPLFVDPSGPDGDPNTWEDNDCHLSPNSPCINVGDPNADYRWQTDIDGEQRVMDGQADVGSDEHTGVPYYGMNLDIVNEPWGTVQLEPNDANGPPFLYASGAEVTLTAKPNPGRELTHWLVYHPDHPGDANHAAVDANNPIVIVMNTNREVTAVFTCGDSVGLLTPAMLAALGLFVLVRRRG